MERSRSYSSPNPAIPWVWGVMATFADPRGHLPWDNRSLRNLRPLREQSLVLAKTRRLAECHGGVRFRHGLRLRGDGRRFMEALRANSTRMPSSCLLSGDSREDKTSLVLAGTLREGSGPGRDRSPSAGKGSAPWAVHPWLVGELTRKAPVRL